MELLENKEESLRYKNIEIIVFKIFTNKTAYIGAEYSSIRIKSKISPIT